MKSIFVLGLVLLAGICTATDLGTPATIEQFPGIVQVEVGYGPLWVQGCAGSVITNAHILSAARCFSGILYDPRIRRIRAGATTRGNGGDIVLVQREHNHPSFDEEKGFDGDITVVRLQSALTLGSTIQQTPIVTQGTVIPDGSQVIAAGWGSIAQGTILANRDLHSVSLVSINNAACADLYGNLKLPVTVTGNMICSGRADSGARIGDLRDAGGPLYFAQALVGVHSFGHYVRNGSYPVVSTAVSSYTQWIVATAV